MHNLLLGHAASILTVKMWSLRVPPPRIKFHRVILVPILPLGVAGGRSYKRGQCNACSSYELSGSGGAIVGLTQNLGGETHTFTEVKNFGGGFVAALNEASGNLVPAPECAQVVNGQLMPQPPSDDNLFIPAGGSATVTERQGVAMYQCCIHPWMRLTITPENVSHTEIQ
jgi:hypothetical protein